MTRMTIGERLLALKARSRLSLDAIASGADYKGRSSVQNLFNAAYDPPALDAKIAKRLGKALTSKGQPPIQKAEIWDMVGCPPPDDLAGADTQPQPWLPKETTLIRLVRAAESAASEGPARTIDVPKFARGLLAGLRMIAAKPTSEDDPGFLAAVETQIVIAIHDYAAPIEQSA